MRREAWFEWLPKKWLPVWKQCEVATKARAFIISPDGVIKVTKEAVLKEEEAMKTKGGSAKLGRLTSWRQLCIKPSCRN